MSPRLGATINSSYIIEQLQKLIEDPKATAAFRLKCIQQLVKIEAKRKPKRTYKPHRKHPQEQTPSPRLSQLLENMGTQ